MGLSAARCAMAIVVVSLLPAAGAAQDWACSPWETVNPVPFPLRLSAVVRAGGQFWGFGDSGVAVSRDGTSWQRRSQLSGRLRAVLWTGTEFIGAVDNTILASRDGLAWTKRHEEWQDPIFFTIDLRSIATDGSTLVAVGEDYSGRYDMWSPVVLTSHDGVSWARIQPPSGDNPNQSSLSAVVWANGRFVAIGTYLLTSTDGESWSRAGSLSGSSLATDGNTVMVGGPGLFRSTDLATWQPIDAPTSGGTVAFAGGRFLLAGACAACPDHEASLWTSADGTAWQRADLATPVSLRAFAADGSRLVGVGNGAAASSDGRTWQTSSAPLAQVVAAIAFGGGRYVAVGSAGELGTSEDGANWQRILWGGATPLEGVAWGPAGFVAVGDGVVLTSPDGAAWTRRDAPASAKLHFILCNGTTYLTLSWDEQIFVSSDGVAWTQVDRSALGVDYLFTNWLAAGNGTFIASVWLRGEGGALVASRDGVSWQLGATTRSGLPQVVWGGDRFLATDFAAVLASADGTAWQQVFSGIEFEAMSWAGDRFVAWARPDDRFMSSGDGTAWQPAGGPTPPGASMLGMPPALWHVGGDGAIRRSACGGRATLATLPGLAHLGGAQGTVWRSDLELHNPGPEPIVVGLVATPRDEIAPADQEAITLLPGQARRIDDVLASELAVETAATVSLASWGGPVLAAARTYDETPGGTLGQLIPAFPLAAPAGDASGSRLLRLAGSSQATTGFRTNLGLVNTASAPAEVDVELYRADGLLLGTRPRALRAGESVQLNDVYGAAGAGDVNDGFAVVRTASLDGAVLPYASIIDNLSGDPAFELAARAVAAGDTGWIPGAGHVQGLNGSVWRTDLVLHNPGGTAVECRIELFPWEESTAVPAAVTRTVAAGQSVVLEDVVKRSFGRQRGASLRVAPLDGPVMASARTFTAGDGGSYGQAVGTMAVADAVTPATPRRLIMLRQSSASSRGYRSNLGLVNTSATSAEVAIEFREAGGGTLGRVTVTLGPLESVQLTEAIRRVTAADVPDAVAVISTTTPGAAVLAYGCLIDNRTNDPLLIPAQ